MNKTKAIVLLASVLSLTGCFDPTIDASTNEALHSSLDSLYQTLPIEQSNQLKLNITALNDYFQRRIYKGEPVEEAQQQYLALLHNKTPDEVAEEVERLKPYGI